MDWFHTIFKGIQLFESGMWFIGGLVLCLIGGLFTWEALAFRRRAYRVTARILGVIPNTTNENIKAAYHPVYEFTARDGELVRMKSRSAVNIAGNLPETQRTFLCDPENKYELRSTKPIQVLVGMVLFFSGLGLFKIASVTGRSLMWSGLIAAGLILLWILKGILTSKGETLADRPPKIPRLRLWKKGKAPDKFDLADILTEGQHWQALLKQDKSIVRWMPLFLLLATFLLGFGGYRGYQRIWLTIAGGRTAGEVVRIDSKESTDNSTSYYSIVEFTSLQGKPIEVRDNIGSSSPVDQRGDKLGVIYDPDDPECALIDRGFWSWLLPVGFSLVGVLIVSSYAKFLVSFFKRRRLGKEYL